MIRSQLISRNASKALAKGIAAGIATACLYILVVILTTPNLPTFVAIKAAFDINLAIIAGTAGAVGAHVFFASYGRSLGCHIGSKDFGVGSGSTALGSFFSFFSLVPLGCCGSWLLILSLLPSIFGTTLSVLLIEHSRPLSYAALAAVLGFAGLSGFRLYRRMKSGK